MKGARGVLINITGGLDMTLYEVDAAANRIREEVDPERQHHLRLDLRQLAPGPDAGLGGRDRHRPAARAGAARPGRGAEPQPEQPRLGCGQFRFQAQRPQAGALPEPAEAGRPPAQRGQPGTHLRAAPSARARDPEPARAGRGLPASGRQPAAVATPLALAGVFRVPRPAARSEERGPNLFARVKEFAFTRTRVDRPAERHPPRLPDRGQRPLADVPASLSGATDEISDIPSFLRRERRVEG